MARPYKRGLDYFPFDVDFFSDPKVLAISGEFGIKGEIVLTKLLCAIYRNGYFILWEEQAKMRLLGILPGISPDLLDSIVNRLVRWNFFDKNLFNSARVLTSRGIQRRYFEIVKRRKEKTEYPYLLVNVCNNPVNVCNNRVNVCNNRESKDKQSLSLSNKNKSTASTPPPACAHTCEADFFGELRKSQSWLEQVAMSFSMKSVQPVLTWLDKFELECKCKGTAHRDTSDVRRHFYDWLRININNQNRTANGNNNRRYNTIEQQQRANLQAAAEHLKRSYEATGGYNLDVFEEIP